MKVIFKNPISQNYEVGLIVKKYTTNKKIKYDVVSEKGQIYVALTTNIRKKGHIDERITNNIINKITTNLSIDTQSNYRNKDYTPNILKIDK